MMSCDDFFVHYLAQKNGILTKCVNYENKHTKFFRGFIKKSLTMAEGVDSLWATNITKNDEYIYLFDK